MSNPLPQTQCNIPWTIIGGMTCSRRKKTKKTPREKYGLHGRSSTTTAKYRICKITPGIGPIHNMHGSTHAVHAGANCRPLGSQQHKLAGVVLCEHRNDCVDKHDWN
eukprot:1191958-Amphidinium_carterae.1